MIVLPNRFWLRANRYDVPILLGTMTRGSSISPLSEIGFRPTLPRAGRRFIVELSVKTRPYGYGLGSAVASAAKPRQEDIRGISGGYTDACGLDDRLAPTGQAGGL